MLFPQKKWVYVLFAVTCLLYFWGLGSYPLMEPDEGRYSEIPREMIESGDYVTPRLNYVKYFEKPLLHYWLTASAFKLFGHNEFASRFFPALEGFASVALVAFLGIRMKNALCGLLSATILATTLLQIAMSRINTTDMTLSFFLTLAFVSFYVFQRQDTENKVSARFRPWLLLFYTSMAFAVLTKGLIGVVLPGGVLLAYIVLTRKWRLIPRALYLPGIALFFVLTVPAFVLTCRTNPDFFWFFFVHEHFLRYTTTIHDRYEPVWFFAPVLLAAFAPWTGFLFSSLYGHVRNLKTHARILPREDLIYLLCWFAVIFVFFSLSKSKLIPYILPLLPPLALIVGSALGQFFEVKDSRGFAHALTCAALVNMPLGIASVAYPHLQNRFPPSVLQTIGVTLGCALIGGCAFAWLAWRRKHYGRLLTALAVAALVWSTALLPVFGLVAEGRNAKEISQAILAHRRRGDVIAQYADYDQGIPFYTGQRLVIGDYVGELAFGAKQETDPRWFLDREGMHALWRGNTRVILVIKERDRDKIVSPGEGITLARYRDQWILANRE